jgi:hypothetical protein
MDIRSSVFCRFGPPLNSPYGNLKGFAEFALPCPIRYCFIVNRKE